MNKEYEYSFKVRDIIPFIDYCVNNNYELKKDYEQTRILYKNGGKVMARITKNVYKDNEVEILNFKDDNLSDDVLKESRESKDLIINDENREFVKSLLEILELNQPKKIVRKRYVYVRNNVIFEIDKYITPVMNVVAIEGEKDDVDNVYTELKVAIDNNIVKD
ncbi:MAG: hypothetical protein Q4C23_02555 [Mycoplasmatota bacterium]|nr:hypothetical protein [Mycoplasmatota bacterium]